MRLLPQGRGDPGRLELLGALGASQAAGGRIPAAVETLALALDELPVGALGPRVALTIRCAALELLLGRREVARRRLLEALELVPDDAAERVHLEVDLAIVAWYSADGTEMQRRARSAVAAAERQPSRALRAKGWSILAYTQATLGHVDDARRHLDQAAAELARATEAELGDDLDVAARLASASFFLDCLDDMIAQARRGLDAARSLNRAEWVFTTGFMQAVGELALGHVERAARTFDDGIDAARLAHDSHGLMWSLGWRGRAALLEGDLPLALAYGRESLEHARSLDHVQLATFLAGGLAETLIAAGGHEQAVRVLVEHGGGTELPRVPAIDQARTFALLAEAAAALGRRDETQRWLGDAQAAAERLGLPMARAHAARARAAARVARGEHVEAAAAALDGAGHAESCGAVLEGARLRLIAGSALAVAGRRDAALVELEHAEPVLDERGAVALREDARRALRRLGRRRRPRTRRGDASSGLASLSEREREVADLAAAGRTNPQIASELFLSLKTVETHLRNIFRKLDLASRVELARMLAGGGPPPRAPSDGEIRVTDR